MSYRLPAFKLYNGRLDELPDEKILMTTLNAFSYNVSRQDLAFREALKESHVLVPDGIGVVWAMRLLYGQRMAKISGADMFVYEMKRLEANHGKAFFLGSTEDILSKIEEKCKVEYPHIQIKTYSPPFKHAFCHKESAEMIETINAFGPDVLFVGMTAPKQEKWAYKHLEQLRVGHICCIGAVFDFYAGRVKRAPAIMIDMGLEWFWRLVMEPRRMWKRYLIGNTKFVLLVVLDRLKSAPKYPKNKKVHLPKGAPHLNEG